MAASVAVGAGVDSVNRQTSASYLILAATQCVTAAKRLESLSVRGTVPYSSFAAPSVREISLTLAGITRLLTMQSEALLLAENLPPLPRGSDLPEVIARLRMLPNRVLRKRFPAGGLVSVCYTLTAALDDLLACLKDLRADPHDRRSWLGFAAGGTAGILAAIIVRKLRRAVFPMQLPRWMFGALLALLVAAAARQGHGLLSLRRRLDGLSARLQLILRVLLITTTIFHDTNKHGPGTSVSPATSPRALRTEAAHSSSGSVSGTTSDSKPARRTAVPASPQGSDAEPLGGRRTWSHADLIGDLSESEFKRHSSAPLRRMLEATGLPQGVVELGTSRHTWLRVLRYVLDVVYAAADAGFSCELAARHTEARRPGAPWWGPYGRLLVPFATVAAGAWYAAQPAAAAERAASVLHDCGIDFISGVWRAIDMPALRLLAAVTMPRLTVNKAIVIDAVSCHLIVNAATTEDQEAVQALPAWLEVEASFWEGAPSSVAGQAASTLSAEAASARHSSSSSSSSAAAGSSSPGTGVPLGFIGATYDGTSDTDTEPASARAGSASGDHAAAGSSSWPWPQRQAAMLSRPPPPCDVTIFLYIHGGGFVGSSFASDVALLARWAHKTPGLCVLYPHYSLSPEVRFPVALNECFRAYTAARRAADAARAHGRKGRLVMFGESAGGNLAAAVCVRAAQAGLPQPDRLVLAYPALNLNSAPSPSRALHLNDPIVPLRMLQRLAAAYMPEGSAGRFTRDPEVHPGLAPDAVLQRFPRTELVLGGLDPLLDDGIEMNSRLRRLGVAGEMLVYRALPHGFFTFNWLPPAKGAIQSVLDFVTNEHGLQLCDGAAASNSERRT